MISKERAEESLAVARIMRNPRLAREMLEVLEALNRRALDRDVLLKARAAIAKARGKRS